MNFIRILACFMCIKWSECVIWGYTRQGHAFWTRINSAMASHVGPSRRRSHEKGIIRNSILTYRHIFSFLKEKRKEKRGFAAVVAAVVVAGAVASVLQRFFFSAWKEDEEKYMSLVEGFSFNDATCPKDTAWSEKDTHRTLSKYTRSRDRACQHRALVVYTTKVPRYLFTLPPSILISSWGILHPHTLSEVRCPWGSRPRYS